MGQWVRKGGNMWEICLHSNSYSIFRWNLTRLWNTKDANKENLFVLHPICLVKTKIGQPKILVVWNPKLVSGKPLMAKLMVARMPWPSLARPQSASNVQGKGRHSRVGLFEPSVRIDLSLIFYICSTSSSVGLLIRNGKL